MAFFGGDAAVQLPYLIKILAQSIKQYEQLQLILRQGKNHENLIKMINQGLDNSYGLLETIPIKDERILKELKNFREAYKTIHQLYGSIPEGPEKAMLELHDKTIAESLRINNSLSEYANKQEINAKKIYLQSTTASPKGASRINAQVSAQILDTLTQLLKVNGQLLKLQSEQLAMQNKTGKESIGHFQKIHKDIQSNLNNFNHDFSLPRF